MSVIMVTGAASGLGKAIHDRLQQDGHDVISYDKRDGEDVLAPSLGDVAKLDVLINCAGINIINWLEEFREEHWDAVMGVNAKGIYKMSQACLPLLVQSKGTILNITSNAAHMPMTCSLAYNASKGAAEIMTKQLARELTKKYGITVFGVAPNKLKGTGMSESIDSQVVETRGWTRDQARKYQIDNMLVGEETPPESVADFVAYLLSSKDKHKYLSGCILPYGL